MDTRFRGNDAIIESALEYGMLGESLTPKTDAALESTKGIRASAVIL